MILGGSGAGKTTLAEHLARRLELPARDSDQRVVERRGEAIPAIFATQGEGGFRALEAQVVRECLVAPGVVALGAGAWEDPDTRAAVRASGFAVLWLAEVPRRAWARVGGDPGRPLAGTFEQFMTLWACRTRAWSGRGHGAAPGPAATGTGQTPSFPGQLELCNAHAEPPRTWT